MTTLTDLTAAEAIALLERGETSTAELLDALEARIAAVDGAVGALPTTCFERARAWAAADGPLKGLPVAIKDLSAVKGVRTTYGSPIYEDFVPDWSDHVVERIEARGGVVYAKTNTPEFGAGAQTFNRIFPSTRNPWNLSRTVAGSSGGSAAALKSGTAWLAHGSDLGGSLRNPASFCGVVGLRPAPFRVPRGPVGDPFSPLSVDGPMARTVEDCALFLDAMAGREAREAVSLDAPDRAFRDWARAGALPGRVAFSRDLGGITPVDPEVAAVCEAAARRFEAMGVAVEEACPDLNEAPETFHVLRALGFATSHAAHYDTHRDKLKPDVIWNIEAGMRLTGEEIGRALRNRAVLVERARAFFQSYDLLLCPATILPPYPVETIWPDEVAGVALPTYIDWLRVVSAITLTAHPALSLPCGFTAEGLPVGLQMVGPAQGEGPLLGFAAALEAALGLDARPIDPRPGT